MRTRPSHAASRLRPHALAALVALGSLCTVGVGLAAPLTAAFTYQGELRLSSGPATGNYDLQFRLYDAQAGGSQIGPTVTATSVAVAGGLFSVPLDFGVAQFAGDRQWLEIAIRPAGSGSYETLSPRTEVTAAPYAWGAVAALANSVTTTSIVDGTVATADLANDAVTAAKIDATQVKRRVTGTCPTGQYMRIVAQDGSVTCGTDATGSGTVTSVATGAGLIGGPITTSGTIAVAPDGIGTTEINATQVQRRVTGTCTGTNYVQQVNQDGTVACGAAPESGWSLTGNAGTNPATNFLGTTDNQPLVLRTGNAPSLRIVPSAETFGSPALPITTNTIGGSHANEVTAGVRGATIAGGGVPSGDSEPGFPNDAPNRVTDVYGSIGGGYANRAGDDAGTVVDAPFATVSGGSRNVASGGWGAIGGGGDNIAGPGLFANVGGGLDNIASGLYGTVGGGQQNSASGIYSSIGGGAGHVASGFGSTISGGFELCAGGNLSWAGGYRAKVRPGTDPGGSGSCSGLGSYPGGNGDAGTFVWADSQNADFVSTGPNQFLVRANGGVGINTSAIPFGVELALLNRPDAGNFTSIDLATRTNDRRIQLLAVGTGLDARFSILNVGNTGSLPLMAIDEVGAFSIFNETAVKPLGGPWAAPSDARLKTDVAPLTGTLERLLALRGVEFAYRADSTPKAMYAPGRHAGFIAQEVERVFPDWVSETDAGYRIVGPRGFEALTVEALRELRAESAAIDGGQSARIAALEAENAALRGELERRDAEYRARLERLEGLLGARTAGAR